MNALTAPDSLSCTTFTEEIPAQQHVSYGSLEEGKLDMKIFIQELHRVEEQIEAINRSKI